MAFDDDDRRFIVYASRNQLQTLVYVLKTLDEEVQY